MKPADLARTVLLQVVVTVVTALIINRVPQLRALVRGE